MLCGPGGGLCVTVRVFPCRSGAILPTLQALQKSIQRHVDGLSKL